MMQHSFRHRHAHQQKESNHKVLMNIDKYNKIVVEIDIIGGYLIEENDPFLVVHDGHITRKVYTMPKILEYCKETLSKELYFRVEKFFMEMNT